MEEILALANKLGGLSFATLLLVILWGSWKRVWVWGREVTELDVRLQGEKQVITDERDWWRNLAVRATGLAETQGQILRVRNHKELDTIDALNKKLLEP